MSFFIFICNGDGGLDVRFHSGSDIAAVFHIQVGSCIFSYNLAEDAFSQFITTFWPDRVTVERGQLVDDGAGSVHGLTEWFTLEAFEVIQLELVFIQSVQCIMLESQLVDYVVKRLVSFLHGVEVVQCVALDDVTEDESVFVFSKMFAFAITAYLDPHRFELHSAFGVPRFENFEEFFRVQPVRVFVESWWSW